MLTFIRIMLPPSFGLNPVQADKIRRTGRRKSATEEDQSFDPSQKPWQRELDRLARGRGTEPEAPRTGRHEAPPPPHPLPNGPEFKQGTLTDLKIWWGKATVYKTPDPKVLKEFSPGPAQKRNRWQQF